MMRKTQQFSVLAKLMSEQNLIVFKKNFTTTKRMLIANGTNSSDGVSIENIFSDFNRTIVLTRMKDAKPLARPVGDHKKGREAAVLVPMCHINGEPALLLMIRSMYMKNHRGEISFPGGMKDLGDTDLTHTALRETFEEIGLASSQVDVWGTIPASPSRNSGWVTPVLGYCHDISMKQLSLNKSEVEEVFFRTVSSLCDPASQRQTQWRYPGTKGYTLPVFLGEDHRIWGLTAVIIHQVLNLIAPDIYKFKLKHKS